MVSHMSARHNLACMVQLSELDSDAPFKFNDRAFGVDI